MVLMVVELVVVVMMMKEKNHEVKERKKEWLEVVVSKVYGWGCSNVCTFFLVMAVGSLIVEDGTRWHLLHPQQRTL